MANRSRNENRVARHERVRKNISGTPSVPRLCVYRSAKNIYAQIIDDVNGKTLAAKFRGVAAIEKEHEERYRKLLENVEMKKVFEKSEVKVWECRNCGHIVVGEKAPAACPVCAHPQAYFEVREENY